MPVPSSINDLSTTAASNSPGGSETPKDGDNYIRVLSAFLASLRDKLDGTAGGVELDAPTINNPTFTGTPAGLTKAHVGLANVDNTSDATKNAAAATLANKTLETPAFTGTPTGTVTSGTYTPTVTILGGATAASASVAQYTRIGNVVTVSGSFSVTTSVANAIPSIVLSLPVASNLAVYNQLAGVAVAQPFSTEYGAVQAYTSGAPAGASFQAQFGPATGPRELLYTYTYLVV